MFCMHCGKQIEDGVRFCEFCGGRQENVPVGNDSPAAIQPQEAVTAQPQVMVQPQETVQPQVMVQPQVIYVQQGVQGAVAAPQSVPEVPLPAAEQTQKKKKPPVALFVVGGILIFAVVVIAVIAVTVGIFVFGAGKNKKDYAVKPVASARETVTQENEKNSSAKKEESGREENGGNGDYGQFGDGDIGQFGEDDVGQFGDGDIGQFGEGTVSWDYVDRPGLSDFDWYYAGEYGMNEGVKWLDASEYQGMWKGMIIYSADGSEELVNFDIDITPDNVTLLADWYMVHIGGNELLPEDDLTDTLFSGYEWGNGIHVETERAVIEINEFWEIGGTQYGKGILKMQESTDSVVLLVRP